MKSRKHRTNSGRVVRRSLAENLMKVISDSSWVQYVWWRSVLEYQLYGYFVAVIICPERWLMSDILNYHKNHRRNHRRIIWHRELFWTGITRKTIRIMFLFEFQILNFSRPPRTEFVHPPGRPPPSNCDSQAVRNHYCPSSEAVSGGQPGLKFSFAVRMDEWTGGRSVDGHPRPRRPELIGTWNKK